MEWGVRVRSSRAAKLAGEWLGDPVFGVVIGDLARLSDAVKLRLLIDLAGMGYRPKGRSSVFIDGVKMMVRACDGYVKLVAD
ncbi:hypothetical protein [Vulcanisaeta sp. JCM 16159]|uniref:hypothetical protein n=1 Tax=Vulcanisaeta sp. JCM 16159 TaxID=1295371 RepID=UPI0006D01DA1|nr:hypothetical protein [Vulcanisaeta sp. JCM 16159]